MAAGSSDAPPRRGLVFGRRKGKTLRAGRQALVDALLPRLRVPVGDEPLDPTDLFDTPKTDLWLEVGFGAGEHLAWQAAQHPDIGFIGCEPFLNGVASMVRHVADADLKNVRLWDDDARLAIDALPDGSVGRAFVLFADPWPKTRHAHRRILGPAFLDKLARVLRPGAELRWATDDPTFLKWALYHTVAHPDFAWTAMGPDDWTHRPADWPQTRYEQKALAAGRVPRFFRFIRRG